jgi:hypothetical protein
MAKTKSTSNLVGRTVLIDWPIRWKSAEPAWREKAKAEAAAKEYYFGLTGEIVAYNAGSEDARDLQIKLEDGQIIRLYPGAVTITSDAPNPEAEVIALLKEIRDALKDK